MTRLALPVRTLHQHANSSSTSLDNNVISLLSRLSPAWRHSFSLLSSSAYNAASHLYARRLLTAPSCLLLACTAAPLLAALSLSPPATAVLHALSRLLYCHLSPAAPARQRGNARARRCCRARTHPAYAALSTRHRCGTVRLNGSNADAPHAAFLHLHAC